MAARVVAYKPPTVSQCAEEGHVYEMPLPPPLPITPKPAPSDRQRQKLLVTAIVGVILVAACLLGLLVAIVIRIPAAGGRQEAVDGELVRSPTECPAVACPSVPCADISCPAISCPIMPPVTSCDDGFVRQDGSNSCYKVINVTTTRPEAAAECVSHGAYLVEIGSQEEQTFIERLLAPFSGHFWIGAIRLPPASSFTFIWEHSKQIIAEGVSFTNWNSGEPQAYEELYVVMWDGLGWADVHGTHGNTKLVCEKSLL